MKIKFDVTTQELTIIESILQNSLPVNSQVWVFGSRAKHQAKYNSDLDLAIEAPEPLNSQTRMQLETQFDESYLPYSVDIVDMQTVEPYFKEIIDQQKVLFPFKGNVPELRFPEFSDTWEEKTLGQFMSFKNGINADKEQYGHGRKFINVLDIIAEKPIYHDTIIGSVSVSNKEFEKNEVVFGDILFQRSSETREDAGQSNIYLDTDHSATFGGFVIRGRPTAKFDPVYFDLLLKTRSARKEVTTKSGGSTRFNVGQESLNSVKIVLTIDTIEQQKIAAFLSTVDDKIKKLRRKQELLETYKRGLMQKIFSQEIRFKQDDGTDFPDWEEKKLKKLADRITIKNTDNSISCVPTNSASLGIINQKDYFNKDIANIDNLYGYYIVEEGDYIYNPRISSHAPVGPINKNNAEKGLMSPLYSVFRFNKTNNNFYEQYFTLYKVNNSLFIS